MCAFEFSPCGKVEVCIAFFLFCLAFRVNQSVPMYAVLNSNWCGGKKQMKFLLCYTGELHLTPLHGLAQLRPNFAYLDKADLKSKVDKADNEGMLRTET